MFVHDCLSLCLSVDVLHVDFEVVVAGELLVAQGAFSHGSVGIMGQFVSDQHLLQTKGQVTHVALEGLLSGVCAHVFIQATLLTEGLVALAAFVRLFPGVCAYVHFKAVVLAEGLVTVRALVRSLTCVAADVHSQCAVTGKLLTAVRTDLLLLSCMGLLVALEHRWRDEGLLTQVTLVLLVAIVYDLNVHVECVLALEGGVTLVALKRSLTGMNEEVAL